MHEIIADIVEICYQKGIKNFIICPGSRSAPITLALARHPKIKTHVVADERVAGFTALGMALQSKEVVGLVCTSGTAVLNFAPAVAEALFQEIPLLIFTADRPTEWIAQQDGQTLHQRNVYGKNTKASFEIPSDYLHPDSFWYSQRIINEAIDSSKDFPKGPVHINIPLREPLYPKTNEKIIYKKDVKVIKKFEPNAILSPQQWQDIFEIWESSDKKLIVVGQTDFNDDLLKVINHLQEEWQIPVIGDIVSNLHSLKDTINHQDLMLMQKDEGLLNSLKPDLLVTFGKSLISKNVKLFLRNYKPQHHLHIQPSGAVADTFQTLTHIIPVEPVYFLNSLFADLDFLKYQSGDDDDSNDEYFSIWQNENLKTRRKLFESLKNQPFTEFEAVKISMENLPESSLLHLANSMPVRYANFFSIPPSKNIEVFANRGTSGIDGCTSTAIGAAKMTDKIVTIITGDMAFFYDRNALWQKNLPKNIRIIILNNHGGGIFRMIDAGDQPEVDEFFEMKNELTAESTAKEFGFSYKLCKSVLELETAFSVFYEPSENPKIIEIETDTLTNTEVYKFVKTQMSRSL